MIGGVMGALASASLLGLSAGLSPGPLLTLVITETLKYSPREGIKVALAPLLTDAPIVAVTVIGLLQMSDQAPLIGIISLLGGIFMTYLAYDSISFRGTTLAPASAAAPRSLSKGVVANLLNPSPYLFWVSVGAPLIVEAWRASPAAAVAFMLLFYSLLVGAKVFVALAVGKSRTYLRSRPYILMIRCLGVALLVFAGCFFRNAYVHLAGG